MANEQARLKEIVSTLKENNLRITPQRLAIIKILAVSKGHPSVEQIYDQVKPDFPTTSLATVYKTVTMLKNLNEILELGFPEGGNRYDGNKPYPHPHMVCIRCKKIMDPDLASLKHLTDEAVRKTGYKIIDHRLDFFGLCPGCQKRE